MASLLSRMYSPGVTPNTIRKTRWKWYAEYPLPSQFQAQAAEEVFLYVSQASLQMVMVGLGIALTAYAVVVLDPMYDM